MRAFSLEIDAARFPKVGQGSSRVFKCEAQKDSCYIQDERLAVESCEPKINHLGFNAISRYVPPQR